MYRSAHGGSVAIEGAGVYPAIDILQVDGSTFDGGTVATEGAAADVYRSGCIGTDGLPVDGSAPLGGVAFETAIFYHNGSVLRGGDGSAIGVRSRGGSCGR